jgi:hypothetical protein
MGISLRFGFGSGKEKAVAKSQNRLRDAIARKVCVTASYDRGPIHLFEPYALLQSEDGTPGTLLAVRMDGPAGPSSHEDLVRLDVAKLGLLEVTEQEFTPDPRFDAHDAKYGGTVVAAV